MKQAGSFVRPIFLLSNSGVNQKKKKGKFWKKNFVEEKTYFTLTTLFIQS